MKNSNPYPEALQEMSNVRRTTPTTAPGNAPKCGDSHACRPEFAFREPITTQTVSPQIVPIDEIAGNMSNDVLECEMDNPRTPRTTNHPTAHPNDVFTCDMGTVFKERGVKRSNPNERDDYLYGSGEDEGSTYGQCSHCIKKTLRSTFFLICILRRTHK